VQTTRRITEISYRVIAIVCCSARHGAVRERQRNEAVIPHGGPAHGELISDLNAKFSPAARFLYHSFSIHAMPLSSLHDHCRRRTPLDKSWYAVVKFYFSQWRALTIFLRLSTPAGGYRSFAPFSLSAC
jgi:hypothetical protein